MRRSASHTRRWNAVARTSSGRSSGAGPLVHAAGGPVPRFVQRGAHPTAGAQLGLEALEPAGVPILPRADPEDAVERAEQAVRRDAGVGAQRAEARGAVRVRIDELADGPHERYRRIGRFGFTGATAAAWPEPRSLSDRGP